MAQFPVGGLTAGHISRKDSLHAIHLDAGELKTLQQKPRNLGSTVLGGLV